MAGTLAGTMSTCIKKASEFAANRLQFGKKIQEFGGVQEKLARMATLQYTAQVSVSMEFLPFFVESDRSVISFSPI